MRDPNCDRCNAVRDLQGICTDCGGCFGQHCQCNPCAHGKARSEDCIFCGRGYRPLVNAMVESEPDEIQQDLEWLFGSDANELAEP